MLSTLFWYGYMLPLVISLLAAAAHLFIFKQGKYELEAILVAACGVIPVVNIWSVLYGTYIYILYPMGVRLEGTRLAKANEWFWEIAIKAALIVFEGIAWLGSLIAKNKTH